METKLQLKNGTHLNYGDYFDNIPILMAKLEYTYDFCDIEMLLKKHVRYNHGVEEIFADGDGSTTCVVYKISSCCGDAFLTIRREVE